MSTDGNIVGFAHAFLRSLVGATQDGFTPAVTQSLQEAWTHFGIVSEGRFAVDVRHVPARGATFFVQRLGERPIELGPTLPPANREWLSGLIQQIFTRVGAQQISLLPGLTFEDLSTASVALLAGGEHPQHRVAQRHVNHIVCLGAAPSLAIPPQLPRVVAESIDMLHMVLTGIERFGPGPKLKVTQFLQPIAQYLVHRCENPAGVGAFLASLELPAHSMAPRFRAALLKMLIEAVPDAMVQRLSEGCDRIVAMVGGPQAIGQQVDPQGVSIAGYHTLGQALRPRLSSVKAAAPTGPAGASVGPPPRPPTIPTPSAPPPVPLPVVPAAPVADVWGYDQELGGPSAAAPVSGYGMEAPVAARPAPQGDSGLIRTAARPAAANPGSGVHRMPAADQSGLLRPGGRPGSESHVGPLPSDQSGVLDPSGAAPIARPRRLDPRVDGWVGSYQTLGPRLMERAQDVQDAGKYEGAIKILANVAGYFLDQGQWTDALPIVRLLKVQEQQALRWPEEQKRALAAALSLVLPADGADVMVHALLVADVRERAAVYDLVAFYGHLAVPALLEAMLSRRLNPSTRKEVVALIEAAGPAAGPAIIDAIQRCGRQWNRATPLVSLLGAVGYRAGQRAVGDLLRHAQPKVREEALLSAYKMMEGGAHRYLIDALEDPDIGVVQRSVALLAAANSRDASYTSLLHELVSNPSPADAREEGLIITAIYALKDLGNIELYEGMDAETALTEALRDGGKSGFLSLVKGGRGQRSLAIQTALCDTLAAVGSDRARSTLQAVGKDAPLALREAAEGALRSLAARFPSPA